MQVLSLLCILVLSYHCAQFPPSKKNPASGFDGFWFILSFLARGSLYTATVTSQLADGPTRQRQLADV